ncbi:hypothetical protein BDW42DRAFT_159925 [Aspergillus taichungensis]|uniref:Uncharacterized protein n=1 Tax=Aspergillus taichungensis TaxID=482145 RepID=A0A2J5I7C4_9EURO|nr:hypothetical protein BDW42DRAFT_159925 [Aspergillus taichungensis]
MTTVCPKRIRLCCVSFLNFCFPDQIDATCAAFRPLMLTDGSPVSAGWPILSVGSVTDHKRWRSVNRCRFASLL